MTIPSEAAALYDDILLTAALISGSQVHLTKERESHILECQFPSVCMTLGVANYSKIYLHLHLLLCLQRHTHLISHHHTVEGEDEDLPLDALFNEQPEGGEGLSLRDVKALLKAPPSDLKFPDRYEWKQEPIQNEFKTVTKDIQDLFLQVAHLTADCSSQSCLTVKSGCLFHRSSSNLHSL